MTLTRRLLAVPLLLMLTPCFSRGAEIRDGAGLFSADAIRQARSTLERAEKSSGRTAYIETVPSLNGRDADDAATLGATRARASMYVLIAKKEGGGGVFRYRERKGIFDSTHEGAIKSAFLDSLKTKDFDAALTQGSSAIASAFASGPAANRANAGAGGRANPAPGANGRAAAGGMGGWKFILVIGLVILAVMFGLRILGAMFGGGRGMGQQGMRPGMGGPGYGGGGGGGGGGFMSSLMGGIGGAVAGNWLYDQFRGRDQGSSGYGGGGDGTDAGASDPGGYTGGGGDFGGDAGGGGGGGDWGGGGGDWGGGGGGDFGGGGGGGGDWS